MIETNDKINDYKDKNKEQIAKQTVNIARNFQLKNDTSIKNIKPEKKEEKVIKENTNQEYIPNLSISSKSQPAPLLSKKTENKDDKITLQKKRLKAGGYDQDFYTLRSKDEAFSSTFLFE